MHRFFADPFRSDTAHAYLTPDEARHALTVLRLKPSTRIEAILDQRLWEAEIEDVSGHDVYIRLLRPLPSPEPELMITLYQGLPKADKMDWIVQKATEIGISRIVPLNMKRCVSHPDPKKDIRKLDRWRRIIHEACKQSGRCAIPEITEPVTLPDLVSQPGLPELNIVPWEEAEPGYGPRSFCSMHPSPASLGILIGPEGGIDPSEIELLREAGFSPITLGRRILRTETAGTAAAAAFLSLYGEMDR